MYKRSKKIFALCLTVVMISATVAFQNVTFAATPLSGTDRYQTALKIVQAGWTQSDSAIIARGDDLADALAAAPLAYAKGKAPIFLTKPGELPTGVLAELKSLGVKNIYIVGGIGAVSTSVQNDELKDFKVKRIPGKDRVETSYNVALEAFGTAPTKVVIANGLAYADALSISSIAAVNGMPILLVNNKLTENEKSYIAGKTVYAVGGTGVLSNEVVTQAKATRLSGLDRYETNAAILAKFTQNYSKIYLAKGTKANLVDALTGSALAALGNYPIVLVNESSVINAKTAAVIKTNINVDSTQVLLGGTVAQVAATSVEAMKPLPFQVISIE